jgi:hypothetical protein
MALSIPSVMAAEELGLTTRMFIVSDDGDELELELEKVICLAYLVCLGSSPLLLPSSIVSLLLSSS